MTLRHYKASTSTHGRSAHARGGMQIKSEICASWAMNCYLFNSMNTVQGITTSHGTGACALA